MTDKQAIETLSQYQEYLMNRTEKHPFNGEVVAAIDNAIAALSKTEGQTPEQKMPEGVGMELLHYLEYLGVIDNSGVRKANEGKSNYSQHVLQAWSIWLDYPELTDWDKDIIKRVLRTKDGESREMDYNKIIHDCRERIRQITIKGKYCL